MAVDRADERRPSPSVSLTGRFSIGNDLLFDRMVLTLAGGQWTCLLGESGVGKSTVLRLLAGLPTGGIFSGEISSADALPVQSRLAYMAQSDLLAPWLSVRQNLLLGHQLRGESVAAGRIDGLLDQVGLAAHAHKRPAELSGGMRQRAALARTLMQDCEFVLLDEPFSALDARTRAEMQELSFELLAGRTVLLVTHDPAEAARLGHQILLMTRAGLKDVGAPAAPPVRAVDDMDMLRHQAGLLTLLRNGHRSEDDLSIPAAGGAA